MTDFHSHILPKMDDGSRSIEESLQMLNALAEQGISRVVATPHFYAHREKSVADFLKKRESAYAKIKKSLAVKDIHLGAEVAIEHGISELPDIEKLAIEGTHIILLELPYRAYAKWMSEEIYNISAEYNLKVMLAHVHRYLPYYSKDEIETILSTDAILQINNEAFANWKEKKIAKRVINEYDTFAFGSDSHDLTSRKPNWDMLKKKVKSEIVSASDSIFDKYKK